jgi:hypothetical protein
MNLEVAQQHLAALRAATTRVELGPFGYAAVVTDEVRAFQALAADCDALARLEPELVGMTRDGSAAAVIYAALLLRLLGHDVAPLLARYRDDRRSCSVLPGGCTILPPQSLADAASWATHGTLASYPMPMTRAELDAIAGALWFELPSAAMLAAAPKRRRNGRTPEGAWVSSFAELLVAPARLTAARAELDTLLGHIDAPVRLYAALLLRALERPAGERALAAMAAVGGSVDRLHPGLLNRRRTRAVPIADVIAGLATWP